MRQLLRSFPNGSVNVFDRDLRYLLAEGKGLRQVGLSSEMLVGKTLDDLFEKAAGDFVKPYYLRAFAGEEVEFELPLAGHVFNVHAAPLDEEGGEVRTIIAVAQNVTEQKRAEGVRERLLAQELKIRSQVDERKRISRELHDRVAHSMGVVHQSLELYEALEESNPELARAKLKLAKEMTREAMESTRDLSSKLRSPEAHGELSTTLSSLLEVDVPPDLACGISVQGDETLVSPHIREQLFVILREGVRNAVEHSEAGRVGVEVRVSPEEVKGRVRDDGWGFAQEDTYHAGGLRSMKERAELVGGTFEVSSVPGAGTAIWISIPLERGSGSGA